MITEVKQVIPSRKKRETQLFECKPSEPALPQPLLRPAAGDVEAILGGEFRRKRSGQALSESSDPARRLMGGQQDPHGALGILTTAQPT
jgi:hypothetical protein